MKRAVRIHPLMLKFQPPAREFGHHIDWKLRVNRLADRLATGEFDSDDCETLGEYLSTCLVIARMAKNDDAYRYCETAAASFVSVMRRRREKGVFRATGDELRTLDEVAQAMADAMADLPPATIEQAMWQVEADKAATRRQMQKERQGATA